MLKVIEVQEDWLHRFPLAPSIRADFPHAALRSVESRRSGYHAVAKHWHASLAGEIPLPAPASR